MHWLIKTIGSVVTAATLLPACHSREFQALAETIDSTETTIEICQNQTDREKRLVDSLDREIGVQMSSCRSLNDSELTYIEINQDAFQYNQAKTKGFLRIMEDLSKLDASQRDAALLHYFQVYSYGKSRPGMIDTVRETILQLDQRKRDYIGKIQELEHFKNTEQDDLDRDDHKVRHLELENEYNKRRLETLN